MRVLAWISLVVGVVSLFVAPALLIGNADLAVGGPMLLPSVLTYSWRLLIGPSIWLGGVGLSVAWIAFRRLPGLAWLSLLVLLLLLVPYLGVGILPTLAPIVAALIVGGLLVPVGVAAIGSAIGGAVNRRRAQPATV